MFLRKIFKGPGLQKMLMSLLVVPCITVGLIAISLIASSLPQGVPSRFKILSGLGITIIALSAWVMILLKKYLPNKPWTSFITRNLGAVISFLASFVFGVYWSLSRNITNAPRSGELEILFTSFWWGAITSGIMFFANVRRPVIYGVLVSLGWIASQLLFIR